MIVREEEREVTGGEGKIEKEKVTEERKERKKGRKRDMEEKG